MLSNLFFDFPYVLTTASPAPAPAPIPVPEWYEPDFDEVDEY